MYKVFQALKSDEALMARSMAGLCFGDDDKLRGVIAKNLNYYDHVANVDANNDEDVFMIMNRWEPEDEDKVERLEERVSSLSVGDIIVRPDKEMMIVASFGFINIFESKEYASKIA